MGIFSHQSAGIIQTDVKMKVEIRKIIPGRMSLLITLFLSITTLFVSTITFSPPVAVGISALTAWIIIQYVFIVAAILAYAFLLAIFRFTNGSDKAKKERAKDIDRIYLFIFPTIYVLISVVYWFLCLYHKSSF